MFSVYVLLTVPFSFVSVATVAGRCPGGWRYKYGNCYQAVSSPRKFSQAARDCRKRGGYLASVHSRSENLYVIFSLTHVQFLYTFFRKRVFEIWNMQIDICSLDWRHFTNSYFRFLWHLQNKKKQWISFTDIRQEKKFVWADNTCVNFRWWWRGEPNNLGNEDCTELGFVHDRWNDISCNVRRRYTCKRPARRTVWKLCKPPGGCPSTNYSDP